MDLNVSKEIDEEALERTGSRRVVERGAASEGVGGVSREPAPR